MFCEWPGGRVMVKLSKTKKGFTLIEMVLVIAILVILALIVYFNVAEYLGKAKSATSKMNEHISAVEYVTAQVF